MFSITRVGPDLLFLAGCFSKNAGCRISGRIFSILQSNCPKHWILMILHIWNFHLKTKIIRVFGACTILHKNALVTLTIVNKLKNVVIFMTSCIEIWQPIVIK